MAKVKRSKIKLRIGSKSKTRSKRQAVRVRVSIPKRPSKPPTDIKDVSVFMHGEKKIGKTSLFAQEEGAFFLEFDPLQPFAIYQRQVSDWTHVVAYLDLLEKDPGNVKTLIFDGVDIAYQLCFNWCCQKMVINHPHEENDYGQSWKFIRDEFEKTILRALNLPEISARFVAHSKWQEVDSHSGGKIDRLMPFLTTQAEEILAGRCDVWAAYMYSGRKRVLVVRGSEEIAAGHKVDDQFRTPEGERIDEIYMGTNPEEAYRNLLAAFNNEQTYVDVEEMVPKKKKKKKKKFKIKRK